MTDFSIICRTCNLEKKNLISLFSEDFDGEVSLGEKLAKCISLPVTQTDKYPQKICYSCAVELENAYKFRVKSIDAFNRILEKSEENSNHNLENFEDPISYDEEHLDLSIVSDDSLAPIDTVYLNDTKSDFDETEEEFSSQKSISDSELNSEDCTSQAKFYECDQCNKKFKSYKSAIIHEKYHIERNKNYSPKKNEQLASKFKKQCTEFTNNYSLHIDSKGNRSKKGIDCSQCDQTNFSNEEYRIHMLQHGDEHPFKCDVCFKCFGNYKKYSRHILYHSNLVFKCYIENCYKSFSIKYKLVEHLKQQHGIQISSKEVYGTSSTEA